MPTRHQDSATLAALEQSGPFSVDLIDKRSKRGGSIHGASIHNPATYEALKSKGMSKSSAAAISNAALNKGYRKGRHGGSRKKR